MYAAAEKLELEGIVAKKKDSRYFFDKKTKDWIKTKYKLRDYFVVCGFIRREGDMTSIVLGKYIDGKLEYCGHVSLGVSGSSYVEVLRLTRISESPFDSPVPPGNEGAVWVSPIFTCAVDYMQRNPDGSMRQPVFRGICKDGVL